MPSGACRTSIDTSKGSRRLTSQIASVTILWASTLAPATFPLISTTGYPEVWTVVFSDSTQCSGSPVLFGDGSRQWIDHKAYMVDTLTLFHASVEPEWWATLTQRLYGRSWSISICCEKSLTTMGISSPCFAHRPFSEKNGRRAGMGSTGS